MNDAITILVVEDEELIQAMVEEALSDGGFARLPARKQFRFYRTTTPDTGRS